MRRIAAALLLGVVTLLGHSLAGAQGAVAGRVLLPAAAPPEATPDRYRTISPGVEMLPPDPPAAIVYLEPLAGGAAAPGHAAADAPGGPAAAFAQQGLQFRPGLAAVRTGTTVAFPNRDDTYHSVFSYSAPKRFDLGRYRKDEEPASVTFDKPGVVKLFCEIHEHMRGTLLVLDTPHFAKTAADGTFRIDAVPPARYRLTAWVDDARVVEREVDVAGGADTTVEIDAR
jgi:plastocyanin